MRITQQMMSDAVVSNIMTNQSRLSELERQLTSGKRLSRPSDDPAAVERTLTYRAGVEAGDQYLKNMDAAKTWLDATDASLNTVTTAFQRVRELAVEGGNSTLSQSQSAAIGAEVDQILQHTVDLGNSSIRGQRLFAGLKTDANPYTYNAGPPSSVTFTGDNGQMMREMDVGVTMQINTPGSAVFPQIFNALITLRDDLNAGNSSAVSNTDLTTLDSAMDNLMNVRSAIGAKSNRIETMQARQQEVQVRLTALQSKEEDTDFDQAISAFSLQQTLYQASLQAGAKAIQPSLMDYLR